MHSFYTNTNLTLPLKIGGKRKNITFSDGNYFFNTCNEEIINAIKESHYFKIGKIVLSSVTPDVQNKVKNVEIITTETIVEQENVDIQKLKDLLRSEPYNIPHQQLKTPESVKAKAVEMGLM